MALGQTPVQAALGLALLDGGTSFHEKVLLLGCIQVCSCLLIQGLVCPYLTASQAACFS